LPGILSEWLKAPENRAKEGDYAAKQARQAAEKVVNKDNKKKE